MPDFEREIGDPDPHPPVSARWDRLGCQIMGVLFALVVVACVAFALTNWRLSQAAPPPATFGPATAP